MLKTLGYEILRDTRDRLARVVDGRWDNNPFGTTPRASREDYLDLWQKARQSDPEPIAGIEQETGFAIDKDWLDELALHTQIVKKRSELAYSHGRLLYSLLRQYIARTHEPFFTIFETGTARGFSALCMAKALEDSGVDGRIVTLDVLPHLKAQIWNCIDDHERPKSRAELLEPWKNLSRRILFMQADTLYFAPRVGLDRIHFAFLDAQHTRKAVLAEFAAVERSQRTGDMVFFDDVTPELFPGVVSAVRSIEESGRYDMRRLTLSEQRAYAWGVRSRP